MFALDLGIIRDWVGTWISSLLEIMQKFTLPMRDWMFVQPWLPPHSLLGKIWYGLLDTFIGPFFDFSIFEVVIGGGLIVYVIYQLVTWILNLIN